MLLSIKVKSVVYCESLSVRKLSVSVVVTFWPGVLGRKECFFFPFCELPSSDSGQVELEVEREEQLLSGAEVRSLILLDVAKLVKLILTQFHLPNRQPDSET